MSKPKVTDERLAEIVKDSTSIYDVLRALGLKLAGGSHYHYSRRIKALGIDVSHFVKRASNKGKVSPHRQTARDILVKRESGTRQKTNKLVRSLIEIGRKHECECCGQGPEWRGFPLTLDVDHKNEDWLDDREENLRFLCPNCHSQFSRKLLGD